MKLKKCPKCGKYTLKEICASCATATISPAPPRFSPANKFGKWRRRLIKAAANQ